MNRKQSCLSMTPVCCLDLILLCESGILWEINLEQHLSVHFTPKLSNVCTLLPFDKECHMDKESYAFSCRFSSSNASLAEVRISTLCAPSVVCHWLYLIGISPSDGRNSLIFSLQVEHSWDIHCFEPASHTMESVKAEILSVKGVHLLSGTRSRRTFLW